MRDHLDDGDDLLDRILDAGPRIIVVILIALGAGFIWWLS